MMSNGNMRFRGIKVEPDGNRHVDLRLKHKVHPKGAPTGKTLIINAHEETVVKAVTATSGRKAMESLGLTGSVGIDATVFKGGSEITSDTALERSSSVTETYKVVLSEGSFVLSRSRG